MRSGRRLWRSSRPRIAAWFRDALSASFDDVTVAQARQRKSLAKRRSELANMQDRLLNGYLAGTIDETVYNAKSADLKRQADEVERSIEETDQFDPAQAEAAMTVFDFSQNLVDIWRGSNFAVRREILDCVSSNRTLSPVSLALAKRKPFDILAEGPLLKKSRGDRTPVELFAAQIGLWSLETRILVSP